MSADQQTFCVCRDCARYVAALDDASAKIARLEKTLKKIADGYEAPHWLAAKALEAKESQP